MRPLLLSALLISSGCVSMAYIQDPLEQYLISQQPELALAELEQQQYKTRDQTLYHLNKAVLLRMQGKFDESNVELETAKQIITKLEALSLREQATAISVNDAMRSYLPPPFERAMLYGLKIINYLELNDIKGARIETLQLDVFLKQNFEKKEPPFARYLSGLVFEANNELSDALISYRKAYQAYKADNLDVPRQLQTDLLRLTEYQGLADEHQGYLKEFNLKRWTKQAELKPQGELVVIVFNGLAPRKHETAINVQDPSSGQLHRIAIPFYEERSSQVDHFELQNGIDKNSSEAFEQIDEKAYANLTEQMPGIITRAVARVAVKNKLSDNMADKNPLLGVVTNIATFISEQADTRAWYSLPQQILISRMILQPGKHEIDITLKNTANVTVAKKSSKLVALQQQKQFYSWHWPASTATSRRDEHARITYSTTIRHHID